MPWTRIASAARARRAPSYEPLAWLMMNWITTPKATISSAPFRR